VSHWHLAVTSLYRKNDSKFYQERNLVKQDKSEGEMGGEGETFPAPHAELGNKDSLGIH
jgi:hypothetical protein